MAAPYALIGGRAVAIRGYPRMTLDYDFLTTDPRVLILDSWTALARDGAKVDPRKGDHDDPLAGVVHITFSDGIEADIVLAKWKWERAVIERAEKLDVGGVTVPVPRTADLILLKLAAGGYLDLQDVYNLLEGGNRTELVREVDLHIVELNQEARDAWTRIVSS